MSEWSVREEMVAGKAGSRVSVHSIPIQGVTGKSQPSAKVTWYNQAVCRGLGGGAELPDLTGAPLHL